MDNIELYCGDCLDVMKTIPDKSINLVLIDPPYNIGKDKWDKWKTVDDYVKFMGKVFKEIERILKPNGSFYFFHNDFLQIVELQNWLNKNTQFIFKSLITWNKTNFKKFAWTNRNPDKCCDRNWFPNVEYILYYTFQDETGLNKILKQEGFIKIMNYFKEERLKLGWSYKQCDEYLNIKSSYCYWDKPTTHPYRIPDKKHYLKLQETGYFKKPYEEIEQEYESSRYVFNIQNVPSILQHEPVKQNGHLTPKPMKILETLIKTSSNENDVVLDCFMGSGSTGVACKHTNRKFIGIEVNEKYFELAKKRIEEE